jgi:hypothetical protein
MKSSGGDAGGGPEPADIEAARSRSHGPAAERTELRLREQESTHRWTGTTCRAAPLACSDWSEERDVGRTRLDRVEGGGDDGKPGRTGRRPRCAVAGVLVCAVGALDITPRDLTSHRFTPSLSKGSSRDQRATPVSDPVTMDDCMITSDASNASSRQAMHGFKHRLHYLNLGQPDSDSLTRTGFRAATLPSGMTRPGTDSDRTDSDTNSAPAAALAPGLDMGRPDPTDSEDRLGNPLSLTPFSHPASVHAMRLQTRARPARPGRVSARDARRADAGPAGPPRTEPARTAASRWGGVGRGPG